MLSKSTTTPLRPQPEKFSYSARRGSSFNESTSTTLPKCAREPITSTRRLFIQLLAPSTPEHSTLGPV